MLFTSLDDIQLRRNGDPDRVTVSKKITAQMKTDTSFNKRGN